MKKRLVIFILAMLPLIGFSQVVIYSACNYSGKASVLGPGNYHNSFQFHMVDNSLSSIRVPQGFRVELYDNIYMLGTPYVASGNVACLPSSFNDRISSIRVTYNYDRPWDGLNPEGGISAYTGCQYTGRFAFLPPGNYSSLRNVIGNDAISSFRVPRGMVVELFQDDDFRGPTTGRITSDNLCLTGYWNNRASSARIYYAENGGWLPPPPPSWEGDGTIRVYSGCSYRGQSATIREGVYNDLRAQLGNTPLAALQISPGMEVELYSGPNLTGSIMGRFTSNQSCLSPEIQFRARSARVFSLGSGGGNWDGKGVALFADCNYRGRSQTLAVGRYNNLSGSATSIRPSSIRVSPGYTIQLFLEPNFKGASAGFISENESCLGDYWRGRARSAIVTYNPGAGGAYEDVVIYADCYFRGRSQVVRPGYYNNMMSLGATALNPASLRVPPGYKLDLFQQDNFTGARATVTADNACISANWRGRVRSMIVTYNGYGGIDPGAPGNQAVTIYQGCYFGGRSATLREGRYESVSSAGITTGSIASLKVPIGFEVEIYQYNRFTGSRIVLRGDNTCLPTTHRNRVGSMIIRRTSGILPFDASRDATQTMDQD